MHCSSFSESLQAEGFRICNCIQPQ